MRRMHNGRMSRGNDVAVSAPDEPVQWPHAALTRDGAEYRIRPIRPDDAQRDRDFIEQLSEASRFERLMSCVREPAQSLINRFVGVNYHHEMAFVAVIGPPDAERIIGVARYAALPNETDAEFAVAVSDPWQSRGVGTTLMHVLLKYAKSEGLQRVHGIILAYNDKMIEFARKLGMKVQRRADDTTVVEAARDL